MKQIILKPSSWLVRIGHWLGHNWWCIPTCNICICAISGVLIICGDYETGNSLGMVVVGLLFISLLILVHCVIARKYKRLWTFIILFVISCLLWIPLSIISLQLTPYEDLFGKKNPIPEGFPCHEVLDYDIDTTTWEQNYSDAHVDCKDKSTYLQVWSDGSGGMYCFDFYADNLPKGKIWLKGFEATNNIPLSNSWGIRTGILTNYIRTNETRTFKRLVEKQDFLIHDGDWGDYYAVRLEVWFRDAKSRKSQKLMEKTYRMEGWMR